MRRVLLTIVLCAGLAGAASAEPPLEQWGRAQWLAMPPEARQAFAGGLLSGLWWGFSIRGLETENAEHAALIRDLLTRFIESESDKSLAELLTNAYMSGVTAPIVPLIVETERNRVRSISQ